MMTEAMPRLAREVWASFVPVGKGGAPGVHDAPKLSPVVTTAGSRVYLDATGALRVPRTRAVILGVLGHIYADLAKGVAALCEAPEFKRKEGDARAVVSEFVSLMGPIVGRAPGAVLVADPDEARRGWERMIEEIPAQARARVEAAAPDERLRQAQREVGALFRAVRSALAVIPGGILAHRALARLARGAWADGVRADVDTLLRGLPGNVTTEMDLLVGDLTDKVRPYPQLAEVLRTKPWSEVRAVAPSLDGGAEFIAAMDDFLRRYGVRGAGEIDVSRPRWRDDPSLLVRVIVGGLSAGEAGAHRRRHAAQVAEGDAAAERIIAAAPACCVPSWRGSVGSCGGASVCANTRNTASCRCSRRCAPRPWPRARGSSSAVSSAPSKRCGTSVSTRSVRRSRDPNVTSAPRLARGGRSSRATRLAKPPSSCRARGRFLPSPSIAKTSPSARCRARRRRRA